MAENVTAQTVNTLLDVNMADPQQARIRLGAGESAWNPASTKNLVSGPARLVYTRYADGGVELEVTR